MIYVGVTADINGAFAIVYGRSESVHYEAFKPDEFKADMDNYNAMDVRCVVEMPGNGIIETPEKINPATFARMYCRQRGIPFMFVKHGTVRREYGMKDEQTMKQECKLRYPGIELRGEEREQEEAAKAVLLAKYARRYL